MSKKQRQNAEPFPDFPKPPPPPSPEAPKLTVKEVEAVKPPEPPKPPKVKETSRSGSHLKDVPPPPPPLSTTDFIIKMAKTKAKFYYESKEISSDKAIAIIKKNPDLNVRAKKTGAKQQVVYISKKPIVIEVKEESKN